MNFNQALKPEVKARVESCDLKLKDPARLKALIDTGLMDTPNEEAFDRLARMAAQILNVPYTIISLLGDEKQFFKASYGLPKPLDTAREIPIDASICRFTLAGEDIITSNATQDALLMFHPTTAPWGIAAFLGIPMVTSDGHIIGSFCAIDTVIHNWSSFEIEMMRELTRSVMTEIELRKQIKQLATEREMKSEFVISLTHDLRNPIGIAKLSADLLLNGYAKPEEIKKLHTMIFENLERADLMIRDLLDVNRVGAGNEMNLDISECNLGEIIRKAANDFSSLHKGSVVAKVHQSISGYWDGRAIRRMLDNLIGNAIKYGSPDETISVHVELLQNSVQIKVHNKGNPIPPENFEAIFEPFGQASNAKNSGKRGWGLGLTLVRGIAHSHGGKVSVDSHPKEGTTFTVTLPIDSRIQN